MMLSTIKHAIQISSAISLGANDHAFELHSTPQAAGVAYQHPHWDWPMINEMACSSAGLMGRGA